MDMTYNDIVNTLKQHSDEYIRASNVMRDTSVGYRERVFNAGLAIQSLQNLKELANRYPQITRRLPKGTLVDYSDQAMFRVFERQRGLYLERLKNLKNNIKDGNYSLNDEMALKVERLRDTNNVIKSNETLNVAPGALDEKRRAVASILGTALKYPIHIISKILEGGARIIGNIASIPVHMFAYPYHLITKKTPYDGKVANEFGEKIGEFIARGSIFLDNAVKRM